MSNSPADRRRPGPNAPPPVTPRMTFQQVEVLLCMMLRREEVFREACRPGAGDRAHLVVPEDFSHATEQAHAVTWRCALDYYLRYSRLPAREVLEANVEARLLDRPDVLPEVRKEAVGLVAWAYTVDPNDIDVPYGLQQLRQFATERTVVDPMRAVWAAVGTMLPADIPALLRDFGRRTDLIQGVARAAPTGLFDISPTMVARAKIPTGFGPMDVVLNGGRLGGEVYNLYGPTGGGKTRLATRILADAVAGDAVRAAAAGRPPANGIFFTYETPPDDIRFRTLSYLARVRKDRLEEAFPNWGDRLSSTRFGRPLQPYETHPDVQTVPDRGVRGDCGVPPAARPPLMGELERLEEVRPLIEGSWHVHDMRGPAEDPTAGSGSVDEIKARCERVVAETGRPLTFVVIDFLQEVCSRYCDFKNWDKDKHLRRELSEFGGKVNREVAARFDCTVLVLVQLNGDSNTRSATAKQSYADAMDCKTTATNVDFTFQLGTKDRVNNAVVLHQGKTRRSAGLDTGPVVLKFRDDYDDLYPAEDLTVFQNEITPRASTHEVAGPAGGAAAPGGHRRTDAGRVFG